MHTQALETRKKVLGKKHLLTLDSMSNLATTLFDQERWNKAEGLQVQVTKISERVLGDDHPSTLLIKANLAHTFHSQKHEEKAIRLMAEVVQRRTEIIGADHPETLKSVAKIVKGKEQLASERATKMIEEGSSCA